MSEIATQPRGELLLVVNAIFWAKSHRMFIKYAIRSTGIPNCLQRATTDKRRHYTSFAASLLCHEYCLYRMDVPTRKIVFDSLCQMSCIVAVALELNTPIECCKSYHGVSDASRRSPFSNSHCNSTCCPNVSCSWLASQALQRCRAKSCKMAWLSPFKQTPATFSLDAETASLVLLILTRPRCILTQATGVHMASGL